MLEVILAGRSVGQAGCQPAIQPIANRRYLAGAFGGLKFGSHPGAGETGAVNI